MAGPDTVPEASSIRILQAASSLSGYPEFPLPLRLPVFRSRVSSAPITQQPTEGLVPFAGAQVLHNLQGNGQAVAFQPHQDGENAIHCKGMSPTHVYAHTHAWTRVSMRKAIFFT